MVELLPSTLRAPRNLMIFDGREQIERIAHYAAAASATLAGM
jgi:hypothetical protein